VTLDARAEELLHDIASSADDGPRLVFADHIADRWPAHAAWIVAQCSGKEDPWLLTEFRAELPACLREHCRTRGGFFDLSHWQLEARDFVELDPDVLFRLAPWCNTITLQNVRDVNAVAARMRRFAALTITGDVDPGTLATAPGLSHLRHLALRDMQVVPVFEDIVRTTSFVALERLQLYGTDPFPDDVFRRITSAPFARSLRTLEIEGCNFRDLYDALAGLPNLHELEAGGSAIDARFARLPQRFTWLGAGECGIDDDAALAIANSRVLGDLDYLSAASNAWSTEAFVHVLASCSVLRELSCGRSRCGGRVLGEAFARIPARTTLETLFLVGSLGAEGARALAETELPALRYLVLADRAMGHGIDALVQAPFLRQLYYLSLPSDELTPDRARVLATNLGTEAWLRCEGPLVPEARDALRAFVR
jgi:hypothetical protein